MGRTPANWGKKTVSWSSMFRGHSFGRPGGAHAAWRLCLRSVRRNLRPLPLQRQHRLSSHRHSRIRTLASDPPRDRQPIKNGTECGPQHDRPSERHGSREAPALAGLNFYENHPRQTNCSRGFGGGFVHLTPPGSTFDTCTRRLGTIPRRPNISRRR